MTQELTVSPDRRTFLKAGLAGAGIMLAGSAAFATPARASNHFNINVDVRSTINRSKKGVIPVRITSRVDGKTVSEVLDEANVIPEALRFGPYFSSVPEKGTAARSYKLNKAGTVLDMRFESGAGSDNHNWWDDDLYSDVTMAAVTSETPRAAVWGQDADVKLVGK